MTRKFFGNPGYQGDRENPKAVDEAILNARKLEREINKIKQSDPEGWKKAELNAAKEWLLNEIAIRKEDGTLVSKQKLDDYQARYKKHRSAIYSLNNLQELQAYASLHRIALEDDDFEGLVLEIYQNT